MSERYWTVIGYEGGRVAYERAIPVDDIAESEVRTLLQRLAARVLDEEAVVAASIGDSDEGALAITPLQGESFGFTTPTTGGRRYVAMLGEAAGPGRLDDPAVPSEAHARYQTLVTGERD